MKVRASSATLSAPAFKALVNVLENVERPLGELCSVLWESPAASASHLALGASIAALLQDELLPKPPQRLVAIYVLYDMIVSRHIPSNVASTVDSATLPHLSISAPTSPSARATSTTTTTTSTTHAMLSRSSSPAPGSMSVASAIDRLVDSPLTIILFELSDDGEKRLPEQLFLSHLLTLSQTAPNDAAVPAQISQAPAATLWNALEDAMRSGAAVPKLNISSVLSLWLARHPEPEPLRGAAHPVLPPISGVVLDGDPFCTPEPGHLSDDLGSVATLEDFAPAFVRIPPPFLPINTDSKELRWVDPEPLHEILWDPDMGIGDERGAELREIIARALKGPIAEALQKRVVTKLDADPKLVHSCDLTPQNLPDLVQNNSRLATKMLLKLANSKQLPQYLDALTNMDFNLKSMEVVSHLSSSVKLPPDFVQMYISNCIESCGNITDKSTQAIVVSRVCMFFKDLMKNKIMDVQNHYFEIQTFCIEYTRVRGVTDLYRSLKSYGAQQ